MDMKVLTEGMLVYDKAFHFLYDRNF